MVSFVNVKTALKPLARLLLEVFAGKKKAITNECNGLNFLKEFRG